MALFIPEGTVSSEFKKRKLARMKLTKIGNVHISVSNSGIRTECNHLLTLRTGRYVRPRIKWR